MISKCRGGFEHNLKPMGKFRQCLRCNIVITQPEEYDYDCKICKDVGWLNIEGWTGDRCECNPDTDTYEETPEMIAHREITERADVEIERD